MAETIINFAECYFGYQVTIGKDELGLASKTHLQPKIYLEKKDNANPVIFFTFPDWFTPVEEMEQKDMLYTKATIIFDPKGYDLNNIIKRGKAKEDRDMFYRTISYADAEILANGRCQLEATDYSGVGAFVLSNQEKETIVYFAINYAPKKKIYYFVDKNRIVFKTKNTIETLKVRVLSDPDRLPCLAYEEACDCQEFELKFHKYEASIPFNSSNKKVFIDFGGDEAEAEINRKKYLLIRQSNVVTFKVNSNKRLLNSKVYCPYCHEEIVFNPKHYRGGTYCNGLPITGGSNIKVGNVNTTVKEFTLVDQNGKPCKNFICCKESIEKSKEYYIGRPFRLLPTDIVFKRNYRIAVLGKARSGKTTYISRLFNVSGSTDRIVINPEDSGLFKYYNMKFYSPNLITRKSTINRESTEYHINNTPYYSGKNAYTPAKDFFERYSISVKDKKFIKPTVEGEAANTTRFPFIFTVGKEAYVSMYDIAGEDVENGGEILSAITRGENVSLIIILDLTKDISVNHNILVTAQKCYEKYKATCPVAIVLSKFDTFEEEFNSNCACLSGEYAGLFTKKLLGSSLLNHIDNASEEIESFLVQRDIRIRDTYFKGFNLRFFSASAITYTDAMYHEDNVDKNSEKNGLNFMCAQKRLDLPVLWILHELGEI